MSGRPLRRVDGRGWSAGAGEALWFEQFSSDSERRFTEPVSAWHGVLYARVEGEIENEVMGSDHEVLRVFPVTG